MHVNLLPARNVVCHCSVSLSLCALELNVLSHKRSFHASITCSTHELSNTKAPNCCHSRKIVREVFRGTVSKIELCQPECSVAFSIMIFHKVIMYVFNGDFFGSHTHIP